MISVPISLGELIDKITILEIKLKMIKDKNKLKNVQKEYDLLTSLNEYKDQKKNLEIYINKLLVINQNLWNIEEEIRKFEEKQIFNSDFIECARSVYITNDDRSRVKKEINLMFDSNLVEEKSYDYL